jgi:hypothetical protein
LENSPRATIDVEVLNDELRSLPVDEAAARLAASAATWRTRMTELSVGSERARLTGRRATRPSRSWP